MKNALPTAVIVGRINAGKSTLFNTLSESNQALVSPIPGTTRDLNYAQINWRDKTFRLIDSGGLDAGSLGEIEKFVQAKAYQSIGTADLIIYCFDGQHELTSEDKKIAGLLKKNAKPVILVLNKIDGAGWRRNITPDIYRLGLGTPQIVSAKNGTGTGDLLDAIIDKLPARQATPSQPDLKISIIGKTNVGKSSLFNALLGEERVIVTPLPHTTREPQDTSIYFQGKNIVLVDTAGLRKKLGRADALETVSAYKTASAIRRSDLSLIVTDATVPLSSQDQSIAELAVEHSNGIIIVVNKWDLVANKSSSTINKFITYYQRYFPHLWWAPIIFTSAVEKQRTTKLLTLALAVLDERHKVIPAPELDRLLKNTIIKKAKPNKNTRPPQVTKLRQSGTNPPAFTLYVKERDKLHPAFLNLLEKKVRAQFGFNGTPIKITLQ